MPVDQNNFAFLAYAFEQERERVNKREREKKREREREKVTTNRIWKKKKDIYICREKIITTTIKKA